MNRLTLKRLIDLRRINLSDTHILAGKGANPKGVNLEGVNLEASFPEEAYGLSLDSFSKVKILYNTKHNKKLLKPLKDNKAIKRQLFYPF